MLVLKLAWLRSLPLSENMNSVYLSTSRVTGVTACDFWGVRRMKLVIIIVSMRDSHNDFSCQHYEGKRQFGHLYMNLAMLENFKELALSSTWCRVLQQLKLLFPFSSDLTMQRAKEVLSDCIGRAGTTMLAEGNRVCSDIDQEHNRTWSMRKIGGKGRHKDNILWRSIFRLRWCMHGFFLYIGSIHW